MKLQLYKSKKTSLVVAGMAKDLCGSKKLGGQVINGIVIEGDAMRKEGDVLMNLNADFFEPAGEAEIVKSKK